MKKVLHKIYFHYFNILKNFGYKIIATHSGTFHADDVFAVATLSLIYKVKVIRTRDPKLYSSCDFRIDVGDHYNPKTHDFDHHQKNFKLKRKSDVPYASFGLILKNFYKELGLSKEEYQLLDERLTMPIDANDCGYDICKGDEYFSPYTLPKIIYVMNPTWEEHKFLNSQFKKSLKMAKMIILREIKFAKSIISAKKILKKTIRSSKNKYILILPKHIPWKEVFYDTRSKAKFIIFKNKLGFWTVHAIPLHKETFVNRQNLPKKWGGLRDQDLVDVNKIEGSLFCHRNLFIATNETKKGAIKMAEAALRK